MDPIVIFQPAVLLALWTLLVSALIPVKRFRAAYARQVTAHDFKYGESDRVPKDVSVPNRVFMNLLEAPVLFYAVAIVLYVTHRVDAVFVALAWLYLGLRLAHSMVYLTYNNVFHRLSCYGLSNVTLVVLWARLGWKLFV